MHTMQRKKLKKSSTTIIYVSLSSGIILYLLQLYARYNQLDISIAKGRTPMLVQAAIERMLSNLDTWLLGLWYIASGITIHAILIALCLFLLRDLAQYWKWNSIQKWVWSTIFILFFLLTLAFINALTFPLSTAFPNIDIVLYQIPHISIIWGLLITYGISFLVWATVLAKKHTQIFLLLLIILAFFPTHIFDHKLHANIKNQPNIILIGIDSLRPDHINLNKPDESILMPHLGHWLKDAAIFNDAITPLGRTFPALTSIMTGLYPINHGARENLIALNDVNTEWTLAKTLQKAGYTTAFAMDESRFANFTTEYGFDEVLTPRQGIVDFLFGSVIDTVGTNLVGFLPAGEWLNPIGYANRAASASYLPKQFDAQLSSLVSRLPNHSSHLMVHFCLPHWPYMPSRNFSKALQTGLTYKTSERYARALSAVDNQFNTLMLQLKKEGKLEDAIVAVYSDHGEQLPIEPDNVFNNTLFEKTGSGSFNGHGTSIFSPSQNQVLLSFQRYKNGNPSIGNGIRTTPAILNDIPHTVLGLLDRNELSIVSKDGINLFSNTLAQPRLRFMESAIKSQYADITNVDPGGLLSEFESQFRVTEDLKIRFKMLDFEDIGSKERGVLLDNKIIGTTISTIDRKQFRWSEITWADSQSPDAKPDMGLMRKQACEFWQNELEPSLCIKNLAIQEHSKLSQ